MNSLIQALGLDWRILLAQFFNFSVLVFVLWRFAYKPVFKILEERREKIEKGIKDSEDASAKLEASMKESKEIASKARQEANGIVEEARARAEVRYQEVVAKAQEDIKVLIDKEKKKISYEKEAIVTQVKSELSNLLLLSLKQVLTEGMDEEKDKKLIEKIVKNFS